MGYPTKIATCCHCGTRAALTLDKGRHELSCASCGAPLHDLKMLPKERVPEKPRQKAVSHAAPKRSFPKSSAAEKYKRRKPRKLKAGRKWFRKLAEEVFDAVEDIFD